MSDEKQFKVTIIFKSNQSITFDCKTIDVYRNLKKSGLKEIAVGEPDENYPVYLDLDEVAAVVVKKIVATTGFGAGKKLGF